MARYLNLQVPSSCTEQWKNMTPGDGKRYCLSCQKSVTDFTAMTDSELIQYFKQLNGSTCGRFTEGQLNRNIPLPKKPLPWVKYFFKVTLPLFLLSFKSSAQGQKATTPIEVMPVKPEASVTDTTTTGILSIKRIVSDDAGIPLPGASIIIKHTPRGTVTDDRGNFIFKDVDFPVKLVVSYVGYESKEIKIVSSQDTTEVKLKLTPATMGMVVVGYRISKKPSRKEIKKTNKHQHASIQSPSILTYPNPISSGSKLNVQCSSLESGTYSAEIYNLSGQLVQASKVVYSTEERQITLAIGRSLSGTYLLRVTNEKTGKQLSRQIVVQD